MASERSNIVFFLDNLGCSEPGRDGDTLLRRAATPRIDGLAADEPRLQVLKGRQRKASLLPQDELRAEECLQLGVITQCAATPVKSHDRLPDPHHGVGASAR